MNIKRWIQKRSIEEALFLMKSLIASKLMDFNEIVFIEKNVNTEIQASSLRNKQKKMKKLRDMLRNREYRSS